MYMQTSKAALDFSNNPIFPKSRNILSYTLSHEIFMNLIREKKSTPN